MQRTWWDILVETWGNFLLIASFFSVKWELRSAAESKDNLKILWRWRYVKETLLLSFCLAVFASFSWVELMEARVQSEKHHNNLYKEQLPCAIHIYLFDASLKMIFFQNSLYMKGHFRALISWRMFWKEDTHGFCTNCSQRTHPRICECISSRNSANKFILIPKV